MARSFDLLKHYPDRWRELKEIQAICDTDVLDVDGDDTHTLQHLWKCMDDELNNVFITEYKDKPGADEYACSRWEKILGITPADDMTLDERQFVIFTKLYIQAPYTFKKLQMMLDDMLGAGEWSMKRDVSGKKLSVLLDLSSRFKAEAVKELIDNIVPANMILNTDIAYTTHKDLEPYTHQELEPFTHEEITITEFSEVLPKTEV